MKTYKEWFRHGSKVALVLTLLGFILQQATQQYSQVLVSHWTSDKYGWTAAEHTVQYPPDIMDTLAQYASVIATRGE